MALQLLPKHRAFQTPSLVRFFSSAGGGDGNDSFGSSLNSLFRDVKSSLTQPEQQSQQPQPSSLHQFRRPSLSSSPPPPPPPPQGDINNFDEIRKNLASFRNHSPAAAPPPRANPSDENRRLKTFFLNRNAAAPPRTTRSLGSPPPIGGSAENLPANVFGRERAEAEAERPRRAYGYEELGEKLRKLRPEMGRKDGEWFSVEELSGRLTRLRETESEEKEKEKDYLRSSVSENHLLALKGVLEDIHESEVKSLHASTFDVLTVLDDTTHDYMKLPPKEHLLEIYNHPDNMSAAEKMKIELAKVRDEFKMSQSDCGSTRVQVALLTTKIKYLSSALHKKDKHSRKGLVQMVHKRKSLLKYLRRTDWESYCFVLDKLGLRDVTNYKR